MSFSACDSSLVHLERSDGIAKQAASRSDVARAERYARVECCILNFLFTNTTRLIALKTMANIAIDGDTIIYKAYLMSVHFLGGIVKFWLVVSVIFHVISGVTSSMLRIYFRNIVNGTSPNMGTFPQLQ